ncbi:MAG: PQQ-binding-like beta-propeller repeat protein [Candidatus Aquilonibacter sp.]
MLARRNGVILGAAALVLACLFTAVHLQSVAAAGPGIGRAPAFSTDDLSALPGDNWITNGGSLANERYSPLTEISTSNVAQLKGVWMLHLRGSALAAKYSAESQPIVYDGVIYVPTGEDDVFAINADTGKILWEYQAHLDQTISVICCGWESRGVALGAGKVYIGQIDGKVVALDQTTGRVVWSTYDEHWQDGYSITSAPLYVDGMVITGASGGEYKIRGHVTAYDATTGKRMWRFYTIPAPGEPGHETWPQTGNAWKIGGATVWQTPSVDPKLGLLYFSTGNVGPTADGSKRPGMNLYTASMLALDVKTGKLRWYYQMIHHELWDYDATSPTVLFDATIDGKLVHGIGEAEKDGWLYLLDRTNGKPIFPIPERPVPQNANQKTWPTQPIPSYASFVPQVPTQAQIALVTKQATLEAGHSVPIIASKTMFTPYWTTRTVITPGAQGGTNWQPSSYNPNTHMFYVCAQEGLAGYISQTQPQVVKHPPLHEVGSEYDLLGGFGNNPGTFTAIDATTGKIVWQKHWPEACYSGSATTAGNLVFVGRNGGQLQAYNATNGDLLWSFQTGAGANDIPTIFRRNGHEYLVFYAGGNGLAATAHGDNLWLLGLNGTLGPAPAPGPGQGIIHAGAAPAASSARALVGNAGHGATVFAANCSTCHGATGLGGNGGPNLATIPSAKNLQTVLRQVTNGGGGMPAFKGTLTAQQISDVSAYVVKNIAHGP